jgi:hypothetical protein
VPQHDGPCRASYAFAIVLTWAWFGCARCRCRLECAPVNAIRHWTHLDNLRFETTETLSLALGPARSVMPQSADRIDPSGPAGGNVAGHTSRDHKCETYGYKCCHISWTDPE